jgi:hypothetical protein
MRSFFNNVETTMLLVLQIIHEELQLFEKNLNYGLKTNDKRDTNSPEAKLNSTPLLISSLISHGTAFLWIKGNP